MRRGIEFSCGANRRAFSLIEIVLALAVISFALVGILGLFPVAMGAARDSQQETQAAFIASTIYNDLRSSPPQQASIALSSVPFSEGGGPGLSVNLASPATHYLAYTPDGVPDGEISAGTFENGRSDGGFLIKVQVSPSTTQGQESLSQVEILIEAPGTAERKRRGSYPFVTIVNNGQTVPAP